MRLTWWQAGAQQAAPLQWRARSCATRYARGYPKHFVSWRRTTSARQIAWELGVMLFQLRTVCVGGEG